MNLDLHSVNDLIHSPNMTTSPLNLLRTLLSLLLTFGVNERIDNICTAQLGVIRPKIDIGVGVFQSVTRPLGEAIMLILHSERVQPVQGPAVSKHGTSLLMPVLHVKWVSSQSCGHF